MREVQVKIYLPECIYRLGVRLTLLYRKLRYGCAFRKIPLTQGKFAIVDVEDYEQLSIYKWFAVKYGRCFYAARKGISKTTRRKTRSIPMHRQILNVPDDKVVDHINHNGLDNRKANLRIVTVLQNSWNARKQNGNLSSKYKGVSLTKRTRRWKAKISYKGKNIYLGCFDDEYSAAKAYDKKAAELFGEYAVLNFPV